MNDNNSKSLVVIAHNLRSCHNVGSLLRTADGLGVKSVYLTGYTPYPKQNNDTRLPHVAKKVHDNISKTALGAESSVHWEHETEIEGVITSLVSDGYTVCALEQTTGSIPLPSYTAPIRIALVLGREVEGIETEVLQLCSDIIEIPMEGKKESYNVIQAFAMAGYHIKFVSDFAK